MESNRIKIDEYGTGREQALSEAAGFCEVLQLDKKTSLRIRLLTEETLGMLSAIAESFDADFWLETTEDGNCQLHLTAYTEMNSKKKEEFLKASPTGKNAAAKGFMGKIADLFRSMMYSCDDIEQLQAEYGYDPLMYATLGMGDVNSAATNSLLYAWSMQEYQKKLQESMGDENVPEAKVAWDELERSIVANIADDVIVGIRGDVVELIIKKKL